METCELIWCEREAQLHMTRRAGYVSVCCSKKKRGDSQLRVSQVSFAIDAWASKSLLERPKSVVLARFAVQRRITPFDLYFWETSVVDTVTSVTSEVMPDLERGVCWQFGRIEKDLVSA